MIELFDFNKVLFFVLLFLPGFLSLKVWALFVPSDVKHVKDYILEIISYSCINFALLFWLFGLINWDKIISVKTILSLVGFLFVGPCIWPIVLRVLMKIRFISSKIIHPFPKSWDYFFSLGQPCFMIIHLKDKSVIGGYFGSSSFASSYPHDPDLYVEQLWQLDTTGKFVRPIPDTKGALFLNYEIDFIELLIVNFRIEGEHDEKTEQRTRISTSQGRLPTTQEYNSGDSTGT